MNETTENYLGLNDLYQEENAKASRPWTSRVLSAHGFVD